MRDLEQIEVADLVDVTDLVGVLSPRFEPPDGQVPSLAVHSYSYESRVVVAPSVLAQRDRCYQLEARDLTSTRHRESRTCWAWLLSESYGSCEIRFLKDARRIRAAMS
jgi:hypothetical protein